MSEERITLVGELMGQKVAESPQVAREEIVRITSEWRPKGPAENSIVAVQVSESGDRSASYLSWIGYADLDEASALEPEAWQLIEPPLPYEAVVLWRPFRSEKG